MLANILRWFFIISPFVFYDQVLDASGTPRQLYLSCLLFVSYLVIIFKRISLTIPKIFSILFLAYLTSILINSSAQDTQIQIIEIVKHVEYFLFFILVYNVNWNIKNNLVVKGIITFLLIILALGSLEIIYLIISENIDLKSSFYLQLSLY